ncbi:MAG: DUF6046 domain-containing protein [Odoribacter sp.]
MGKNYNMSVISAQFVATGIANQMLKPLLYRKGKALQPNPGKIQFPNPELKPTPGNMLMTPLVWSGKYVETSMCLYHDEAKGGSIFMQDVLVNVSQSRNIVKTAINGLQGTVKEFVSNGDYVISVACGIVATDSSGRIVDEYPEDTVRALVEMCTIPDSIEVSSDFLRDVFGITKMAITSFSLSQQTYSNRQGIQIEAVSDVDYMIRNEEF